MYLGQQQDYASCPAKNSTPMDQPQRKPVGRWCFAGNVGRPGVVGVVDILYSLTKFEGDCNHSCWLWRCQFTGNQQHWRHNRLTVLSNPVSFAAVLSEVENTFLTFSVYYSSSPETHHVVDPLILVYTGPCRIECCQ